MMFHINETTLQLLMVTGIVTIHTMETVLSGPVKNLRLDIPFDVSGQMR